jgi:aminopeptidase N
MKLKLILLAVIVAPLLLSAQERKFTKADTLRGSLNENRDWWDVLRYDIEVKPDLENKTIQGKVQIVYKTSVKSKTVIEAETGKTVSQLPGFMQIDLQEPLTIDSIFIRDVEFTKFKVVTYGGYVKVAFKQEQNIALLELTAMKNIIVGNPIDTITIYYHGKPKEAKNAPWDGGWIWKTDSLGRPWMSVAVQGLGASAWYPCKDYQGDEPDNGASLTMIVPDTLVAVGNGKLNRSMFRKLLFFEDSGFIDTEIPAEGKYTWEVKNPINNYNIVPYIGKYVNWTDTLTSDEKDYSSPPFVRRTKWTLDLNFWVLDYNLEKAKQQFQQVKPMLRCFEHWFGPYPFYEDGYKLVEAPHLGMEHQSAVAYGNGYKNGYRGRDLSGTGWGLKWDFIIIHESGHEWFANNITTKDIADMWVHEGFTNYSETLYTEWLFGKQAGDEYNFGIRKNIQNDIPIIGKYGVNQEGSGDMYYKAGNMIHIIRKVINNDEKFRQILRGMNSTFWHQTVTTQQIENYITKQSGINFQKTFDQYLRTTQIPQLEYYSNKGKIYYRWTNCIEGFDLPLVISGKRYNITTKWNSTKLQNNDLSAWNETNIVKQYYITAKQVTKP